MRSAINHTPNLPSMWKSIGLRAMELLIGFIMIISSWLHLKNHMMFYLHVAAYKVVPTPLLPFVVLVLPWFMLFSGMLIIIRACQPVGAVFGAMVFIMFGIAQGWAILHGLEIDCGCFGAIVQKKIDVFSITLPIVLAIGCVTIALSRFHGLKSE